MSNRDHDLENDGRPQIKILEQPSRKGLRFRYECERKYAAAIVGVNSKEHERTYPTIKIINAKGPVRVVVSCVTKDAPHRPHPHNLLGKIKVSDGICEFEFKDTEPALALDNLSIQCVKKKDVAKSLAVRKKLGIDPFGTGFDHALDPNSIDLYSLRLCIQVFLEGSSPGVFDKPLTPVVTDPINDRRSKSEPEIVYLTRNEGSVVGGQELGILCEQGDKGDIDVLFYREDNNWEEIAEFHSLGVFKRVAIIIRTPPYVDQDIIAPVEVKILLRRRSTGDVSDSFPFTYLPGNMNILKRKRDEDMYTSCERLQRILEKDKNQDYLPRNTDFCNAFNLPMKGSKDQDYLSGNTDFCNAFNLPTKGSKDNVDHRELESVIDLYVNAVEHSDPLGSTSNNCLPKNRNGLNNLHAKNVNGQNDKPKNSNYSNTFNTDDWIHDLLQTIEADLTECNKEPEIVKEPEIKYITPDPIPNVTNPIPEVQNHNNFIANNFSNNHQGTASFNIPNYIEKIPPLPENFARDMSTLPNIPELQEPPSDIPDSHPIHGQDPQYAMNINENQWSNTLNNVTNSQPLMSSNYQCNPAQPAEMSLVSQMSIDNNFNEHSSGHCMIDNRTQMQSANQENTWNQVQRTILNEFDPLYNPTQSWHPTQEYNDYTE